MVQKNSAMFGSRNHPYPCHGSLLEIPRGKVVLKANFSEAMYENKPEFPGGREGGGGAKQKPSMGGVWIFSETAQYYLKGCME